jgi:hypothetical protein
VESRTSTETDLKAIQEKFLGLTTAFGNQTITEKLLEELRETLGKVKDLQTNLAFQNERNQQSQYEETLSAVEPIYKKLKRLEELGTQTPDLLMARLSEVPAVPQMLGKIIGSKSVMEEVINLLQSWEEPLGKLPGLEKSQESREKESKEIKGKLEDLAKSLEKIKLPTQTEEMEANKKLLEDLTKKQAEVEKQSLEARKEIQEWAKDLKAWQTNSPSKQQIERLKGQMDGIQEEVERKTPNPSAGGMKEINPLIAGLLVLNLLLSGWVVWTTTQTRRAVLVEGPKTSARR